MKIRAIKTMANKIIDTTSITDIATVQNFGNAYAFGEVSNLCNIAGDPQARWERILRIAAIALANESLIDRG